MLFLPSDFRTAAEVRQTLFIYEHAVVLYGLPRTAAKRVILILYRISPGTVQKQHIFTRIWLPIIYITLYGLTIPSEMNSKLRGTEFLGSPASASVGGCVVSTGSTIVYKRVVRA